MFSAAISGNIMLPREPGAVAFKIVAIHFEGKHAMHLESPQTIVTLPKRDCPQVPMLVRGINAQVPTTA